MSDIRVTRRSVLGATILGISLAACSSESDKASGGSSSASDGGGTALKNDPSKVGGLIAVITPSHSNVFFKTESDAAVEAAKAAGYTAQADSHDDDPNRQSELFDSAIANGAAAIICDNAGADVTIGAVKKAVDAKIPVFLIDREINEAGLAVSQIVANNSQGAGLVGEAFVEAMGNKGKYLELLGRETDTNAGVRSNAFHSVIDLYPEMEMAAQETANWDQQEAFNKVQTVLEAHADITGIICGNDTMAVGAVAAVDAAGKTGQIKICGFDGAPDAVEAIKAGKMVATGMQPAVLMAQLAVEQADKFIREGKTGEDEKQSIDCVLINSSNAEKYKLFELSE